MSSGGSSSSSAAGGSRGVDRDHKFDEFIHEVKEIEKRDSVLTSKQQIERLLRPGSTYFNLNPFEVLQIDPTASLEQVKKKYKSLSILVHPDKNPDDKERAQNAFEAVNRSWKILENDLTRKKCMELYDEAKERTDLMIVEKKKKLKKEGRCEVVPEEEPSRYKNAVQILLMKLFAEMERKRQQLDQRDMEERKRKREQEIEVEERTQAEKEWQKNFEESRQNRVNSWQNFQSGGKKKKKEKKAFDYSTPKLKPESR